MILVINGVNKTSKTKAILYYRVSKRILELLELAKGREIDEEDVIDMAEGATLSIFHLIKESIAQDGVNFP